MPNSKSNYDNNNFKYHRYFKNENKSTNINNNLDNNLKNNDIKKENNINTNNKELSNTEMINNNQIEEKSDIKKEEKNNDSQTNPNNNKNINIKNKKEHNIKNKTEIIINRSPSDIYYNTLHEEYLPKKEENQFNSNQSVYRTYEIDTSKYDDNKSSLLGHSLIFNDLMAKNRNYYC